VLVRLFLANNDSILKLTDDSWKRIDQLSLTDFRNLDKCIDGATIGSVRASLLMFAIPSNYAMSKSPISIGDLIEAFTAEYVDPWENVNRLKDHLESCIKNHPVGRYKSPYTTIIQSSGMGKSRLLSQLALHFPLVYISLAPLGSLGFPVRTMTVSDNFSYKTSVGTEYDISKPVIGICATVLAAIIALRKDCDCNPKTFYNSQNIAKRQVGEAQWYPLSAVCSNFTTINHAKEVLLEEAKTFMAAWRKKRRKADAQCNLILAIDEATSLLDDLPNPDLDTNSFRLFRNALQDVYSHLFLSTGLSIFAVLAATASKIGNFTPVDIKDPSNRQIPIPVKLHPPFWMVQNSNIFYKDLISAPSAVGSPDLSSSSSSLPTISKKLSRKLTTEEELVRPPPAPLPPNGGPGSLRPARLLLKLAANMVKSAVLTLPSPFQSASDL
jgi:hypothetical protein